MQAVFDDDLEATKKCLSDKKCKVNARDKDGWTALMYAITNGNKKIVQMLIAAGAKVNQKNKKGLTPLDIAHDYMKDEIEKILKDNGAIYRSTNNLEI